MQLPAYEAISQISNKLFVVPLAYTKEIHNVEAKIIQYFDVRWRLMEENLGSPGERLNICDVVGNQRNDLLCEAVLSAHIWYGAYHVDQELKIKEAFRLNIEAQGHGVLNIGRSAVIRQDWPDCADYLPQLLARL